MDGGPDRSPRHPAGRALGHLFRRDLDPLAELRHVLDRHLDLEVESLAGPGVDDRHRSRLPGANAFPAAQEAGHRLERPLRGRKADALEGRARDLLEALHGQGQVRAALRGHERVDLVQDHDLDRRQHRASLRGEDEEEGLRSGDEDVGRGARHVRALVGRGVAGADGDGRQVHGLAAATRRACDPGQGRAQVPLDVHGQGAERGDVDDAAAACPHGGGGRHQPVDRGKEGGEGLARAGRREDQGRMAGLDLGPAERLRTGRRRIGFGEPLAHGGSEQLEGRGRRLLGHHGLASPII